MDTKAGILSVAEFQKLHPLIDDTIERIARGEASELSGHLFEVETNAKIINSNTVAHTHFIVSDGNGRPRVNSLAQLLTFAAIEYAIPRTRIKEADDIYRSTRSELPKAKLRNEALELFTDINNTGEGGELLLYLLAERVLRLPQIISKMSLKTGTRLHYQGADGVHADVNPNTGILNLYWGESKIHANIKSAITECFKSLAPYLLEPYGTGAVQNNDIRLLNNHVDPGDERMKQALKLYLDPNSVYFNKVHNCGLCLVGGDFEHYPDSHSNTDCNTINTQVQNAIISVLPDWKKHTSDRLGIEQIQNYSVHVFFVPFPNVEDFRKYFLSALGLGR